MQHKMEGVYLGLSTNRTRRSSKVHKQAAQKSVITVAGGPLPQLIPLAARGTFYD